ncbi:hypothetical protein CGZ80_16065 [Rhodopirellula sp. MGV]|nr:hypothetical protein CGZ80_16065 [Rhodopirellula sp. MGV]PNY33635.1 hypothetical protein C2E31_27790 [Rhodopirellula baltica]
MGMSDATWERHANPWSGWTRVATMPLLTVAIWCRVWIGWWSLLPISVSVVWIWINPRLFPPPKSLDNWMSRGVLGEQIWLRAKPGEIASHHRPVVKSTSAIAGIGGLVWIAGLVLLDPTSTIAGMVASMLGKLWFVDRMVWIQRENSPLAGTAKPARVAD